MLAKHASQQRENSIFHFSFDEVENAGQAAEIANNDNGPGSVTANYAQLCLSWFRSGARKIRPGAEGGPQNNPEHTRLAWASPGLEPVCKKLRVWVSMSWQKKEPNGSTVRPPVSWCNGTKLTQFLNGWSPGRRSGPLRQFYAKMAEAARRVAKPELTLSVHLVELVRCNLSWSVQIYTADGRADWS